MKLMSSLSSIRVVGLEGYVDLEDEVQTEGLFEVWAGDCLKVTCHY